MATRSTSRSAKRSGTKRPATAAAKAGKTPAALPRAKGGRSQVRRAPRRRSQRQLAVDAAFSSFRQIVGAGRYTGARSDRKALQQWNPAAGSADADTLGDLPTLRARTRDLARNAPIAVGALRTRVTSGIGTGLRPHAEINRELLELDDETADAWETRAEEYFWAWAERADYAGRLHFADLQAQALGSHDESGDVFVLRRFLERPGDLFGLKLQLVEADRVSTPNVPDAAHLIRDGVQLDETGCPVKYYVQTSHPGDDLMPAAGQWEPIAARTEAGEWNALHVAILRRPEQTRGVPLLAPVIETLKQLDRYTEAEIMAAVVSAFFTVFVESEGTDEDGGLDDAEDAIEGEDVGSAFPTASGSDDVRMGPGAVVDLQKGESIKTANPGRPNQAFEPFVLAILRQVGVALELPFEFLVKHFTASYSASRAALLEAWRAITVLRQWFVRGLCQPVWEAVIAEAVARGYLEAPGFFADPMVRRAYTRARWSGDAPGQIDPVKEIKAAEMRLALGVSTAAEVTSELTGGDWDRKIRRRAAEVRRARAAGLVPVTSDGGAFGEDLESDAELDDDSDLEAPRRAAPSPAPMPAEEPAPARVPTRKPRKAA